MVEICYNIYSLNIVQSEHTTIHIINCVTIADNSKIHFASATIIHYNTAESYLNLGSYLHEPFASQMSDIAIAV